jgi:hypothetical protein
MADVGHTPGRGYAVEKIETEAPRETGDRNPIVRMHAYI